MLFTATVTKWQADAGKRVRSSTGTSYLLNTNRLDSMRDITGDYTSLYYFDNPFDHRDAGHYMVVNKTVAQLITQIDTALTHQSITLAVYPDNDATETAVDTEISVEDFAYAVVDANSATRSWVTYTEGGWDIKTVLVNATLAALLAAV